jgi:hypothetical protein
MTDGMKKRHSREGGNLEDIQSKDISQLDEKLRNSLAI